MRGRQDSSHTSAPVTITSQTGTKLATSVCAVLSPMVLRRSARLIRPRSLSRVLTLLSQRLVCVSPRVLQRLLSVLTVLMVRDQVLLMIRVLRHALPMIAARMMICSVDLPSRSSRPPTTPWVMVMSVRARRSHSSTLSQTLPKRRSLPLSSYPLGALQATLRGLCTTECRLSARRTRQRTLTRAWARDGTRTRRRPTTR
mmetsp:Transcript_41361/g.95542  ORF Transcript_41361/g.95542 Transcript_41361/m.95542 type:complete len:200 (+) Transcript_41361:2317-2916(+)